MENWLDRAARRCMGGSRQWTQRASETLHAAQRATRPSASIGDDPAEIGVTIEPPVALRAGVSPFATARIGAFTYSRSQIGRSVTKIGRYCSIAHDVTFGEQEHPIDWLSTSSFTYDPKMTLFAEAALGTAFQPQPLPSGGSWGGIEVGNDVWIGARVYLRRGVTVGDGAILGANAVITRDVPPYAVVVGNPGRIVKYRFDDAMITRLLDSRWWQYKFTDFVNLDLRVPDAALKAIADRSLQPYDPGFEPYDQPGQRRFWILRPRR